MDSLKYLHLICQPPHFPIPDHHRSHHPHPYHLQPNNRATTPNSTHSSSPSTSSSSMQSSSSAAVAAATIANGYTRHHHANHHQPSIAWPPLPPPATSLPPAAGNSDEARHFLSRGAQIIVRMRGLPYDCTVQQVVSITVLPLWIRGWKCRSFPSSCSLISGTRTHALSSWHFFSRFHVLPPASEHVSFSCQLIS